MPAHTRHPEHDPFAEHAASLGQLKHAATAEPHAATLSSATAAKVAAAPHASDARIFHQWTDGLADAHHRDASGLHTHATRGLAPQTKSVRHDVAALEKAFEHAEGKSSVHGHQLTGSEMKDIVKVARKGGVSTAERQFMDFRMGEIQNVYGDSGANAGADSAYNSFRTHGFKEEYQAYNNRMPNPRLHGNRLGGDGAKFNVKLETTGADGKKEPTQMVDGTGSPIGELKSSKVQLNYGQKKEIDGIEYVYAWGPMVQLNEDHQYVAPADKNDPKHDKTNQRVSGWIPADAVQNNKNTGPSRDVRDMADVRAPKVHTSSTPMEITGGTDKQIEEARVESIGPLHDRKKSPPHPGDYLKRNGNTVNFMNNLPDGHGGVGNDTVTAGDKNVQFFPSSIKHAMPTYKDGKQTKDPFVFVYGRIHEKGEDPSEDRYGWIAQESVHKIPTAKKKEMAAMDPNSPEVKDKAGTGSKSHGHS